MIDPLKQIPDCELDRDNWLLQQTSDGGFKTDSEAIQKLLDKSPQPLTPEQRLFFTGVLVGTVHQFLTKVSYPRKLRGVIAAARDALLDNSADDAETILRVEMESWDEAEAK